MPPPPPCLRLRSASMSLIAGSYEKFIWGFKLRPSEPQTLTLTPIFSYPSHLSAIRTLAAAGPVAASGGADDTIHLYDLSTASSLGSLHEHSASLTSLAFYTPPNLSFPRNLVSAAADGSVCIYDADPFVHLKTVLPHRKAVNDLSIHPSGKLALTVGHDECLAMINLVRGRRSFYCRLGKEASLVDFDVSGDKFFMVMEEKISVHEAEDARLLCEFENKKRVLCATPCEVSIFRRFSFLGLWIRVCSLFPDTVFYNCAIELRFSCLVGLRFLNIIENRDNKDDLSQDCYLNCCTFHNKPVPLTFPDTLIYFKVLLGLYFPFIKDPVRFICIDLDAHLYYVASCLCKKKGPEINHLYWIVMITFQSQ